MEPVKKPPDIVRAADRYDREDEPHASSVRDTDFESEQGQDKHIGDDVDAITDSNIRQRLDHAVSFRLTSCIHFFSKKKGH